MSGQDRDTFSTSHISRNPTSNSDGAANRQDYSNIPSDERRLNLGDYVTELDGAEPGIPGGITTIVILTALALIFLLLFIFGLLTLLKKRNQEPREHQAIYTAAVPNSHFTADNKEMSCLNCRLIEMGSMACYQELCPQCGRPPPR
ncbi:hypothetical protein TCAL_10607 [Tigriopus californicus]|uniref:Uncharacterized protein n=1 Tax=Tigriopus californicus TaxID=6832 RepID=A0A553P372_TIGCA|nr:uncharacterized protein LOC131883921 [Tigriopus californicus]TRY72145.1 hypothetical protein TCAL_10607 [Tigriopus californicus]|eukprot:TCALIF_10607-PA protein Name:"Protein of unknown function" AED:0.00 eAED:0.00 QI:455/1/1/1/0.25/0.4/5/220/145